MKIALTYTGFEHKHKNYVNWLKGPEASLNNDIDITVLSAEKNNARELDNCDALVLSGGIDSDPVFYNGHHDYPNKPESGWHRERDIFEMELYEAALKKSVPILAVCRGLQLVNVLHGGTLTQDLGTLNNTHKAVEEIDKRHAIEVYPSTLLGEISGIRSGDVNSAHHQSIKDLSNDLIINCKAVDGTIEGTEWKNKEGKPFLLCVQWHPERMYKFQLQETPLSKNIRNRFIDEIKKSIAAK